ncbi:MAG: hypothetical protein JWO40_633 [Candidatus Doudnabacteria bacterium]|nr:hypothetical protein [Candidatus Doudnabacteria bacterium]
MMSSHHAKLYNTVQLAALMFDEDHKGFHTVPVGTLQDLEVDRNRGFWIYRAHRYDIGNARPVLRDREGVLMVFDTHNQDHLNRVIRLVQEYYRPVSLV